MKKTKLLIIGAGKRVSDAVLPAIEALNDSYTLTRIMTRSKKSIRSSQREYATEPLESLDQGQISEAGMIYMAVSKPAVPAVSKQLAQYDLAQVDLLIETPVLLFKHFWYVRFLNKFRNVWVAEDSVELPCFDVLMSYSGDAANPSWDCADFYHAAYKYHGLALLKYLLGKEKIHWARVKGKNRQTPCRQFFLADGKHGSVVEPRDYSKGWFALQRQDVNVTDRMQKAQNTHFLQPLVEGGLCHGFKVAEYICTMEEIEKDLFGPAFPGATVTSLMAGMKRVGFYRMLKRLYSSGDGYAMLEALDDMVIDYYLDKAGFFLHPFMGIRSFPGLFLLNSVSGLFNRFT